MGVLNCFLHYSEVMPKTSHRVRLSDRSSVNKAIVSLSSYRRSFSVSAEEESDLKFTASSLP